MKKSLSFLLLLISYQLMAQDRKVVPPSPEAISVFKFSEVPVSPYSGLANTNIPLYEIKLKNMTIPIGLNYHGRGNRVEEIAPRVGLGWSLNYGGMLSRQVRGGVADVPVEGETFPYDDLFTNPEARTNYMSYILNGVQIDEAPDKFMLDLNGESVNFQFDSNYGRFRLQKFTDIGISSIRGTAAEGGGVVAWIIKDRSGNTFYYGKNKNGDRMAIDKDITVASYSFAYQDGQPQQLSSNEDADTNTWHLMEIETVNNEKVEFFYEMESLWHYSRSYDRKDREGPKVRCFYSFIESRQFQVKKITFDDGQITFGKSPLVRQDVFGYGIGDPVLDESPCTLDTVSIHNSKNELLKQYKLQYQYTTSPSDNNQHHQLKNLEPQSSTHLFLSSVQEKGRNGEILPATSLEYSNVLVPNRFSNSQDAWGYYNGKPNGEYLTFFKDLGITLDRNVDTTLCEAGLLKKLILPSGGSVNFTYEQNTGKAPYYINQVMTPANATTHPAQDEMLKKASYYTEEDGIPMYKKNIIISPNKKGLVTFEMTLPYCTGDNVNKAYCFYDVYLGGIYLPRQSTPRLLDLAPGTYELKVIPQQSAFDPSDFHNTFFATVKWNELDIPDSLVSKTLLAGGKRVKKIEYKNVNGTALVKSYKYQNTDGSTSGQILGLPCYFYLVPVGETTLGSGIIENPGAYPMYDDLGVTPGVPLSNVQGNGVGYSYVEEYIGDETSNQGKTVYTYTNMEDAGNYWKFPYELPVDNEWLRGKNLSTSIYQNQDGNYILKKKTESTYTYGGTNAEGILEQPFLHADSVYTHAMDATKFYLPLIKVYRDAKDFLDKFYVYYQTGGVSDLSSTIETDYEPGGTALQKKTNYYYDYLKHYYTSAMQTTNSDGSTDMNYMSYPASYPAGTDFIDNLKSNHILNLPIEQITCRNTNGVKSILAGLITKYKVTGKGQIDQMFKLETVKPVLLSDFKFSSRATGILPPDGTTSVFSVDFRYSPRIQYNLYDNKNNPLMLTTTGGQSTSYQWGYKQQYAVAEVKNASNTEFYYEGYEESTATGVISGIAHTGNKYSTNAAVSWVKPNGRSYVISYWYLSGSVWKYSGEQTYTGSSFTMTGGAAYDDVRINPSDAQITTYTYDPLVGMTSMTDAKGETTTYEYDGFQRLINIKDKDGNIVKHMDYHYQGQ